MKVGQAMRLQTGSAPTRHTTITIEWDSHTDADEAVQGTIDSMADELHRRLWPLGVNPTITVDHA